jgi:S1-C subfamily serine protease
MNNPLVKKKAEFGTAPVFLTAISTILGAIMFLRFGYAVGHLGFFGTLLLIAIGHLVTIPTAMALPIMDMLIKDGRVSRGWLGVTLAPLDAQMQLYLKLGGKGVVVTEMDEGTPAKAAGLMVGDVVIAFDGVDVKDLGKLRNGVAMKTAGTPTTFDILREGKRMTVTITLGELPESSKRRPKARQR